MGTGDGGTGGGGTGGGGTPSRPVLTVEEARALTKEINALNKAIEEQNTLITKLEKSRDEQTEGSKKQLEIIKKLTDAQLELAKKEIARTEALIQSLGPTDELTRSLQKQKEELEKLNDKLEATTEALDTFNSSMTMGAQVGDSLAQSIGITDSSLSKFFDNIEEGNFNLSAFTQGMKSSFSATKIASSIVNTFIDANLELFSSLQKVTSELNKSYGPEYAKKLISSTNSIERSLRRFNIGYEESAEAVESLNVNMSDFSELTDDQISTLATDSALMTKFGVSNEDYAATIQDMTKGFGDSIEAAQENMREMRTFAGAIGKSTKEVMADFGKVKGFLAQYGSNYENIFRRMEVITRKTGVAIQDLQSISQGFDEFEGAATAVGKFNALLGGPFLNTIDMLNTEDPAEQIMKLKKAFDSAGKSVNSMTRRELQAFAGSIPGINGDIDKMKKLFGQLDDGVLGSADSINEFIEGSDDSTDSMKKQADATLTIAESLAAIQKQMALSGEALGTILRPMQKFMQFFTGFGDNMGFAAMGIAKMINKFSTLYKMLGEITTVTKSFIKVIGETAGIGAKFGQYFGMGFLKKIPGLSVLIGAMMAISRWMEGDYAGAALEFGSGLAALIPGWGTAISVGIDAGLMASDYAGYTGVKSKEDKQGEETEMAVGGIVTREVNNVTIGERGREAVIPLEDGKDYLVDPLSKAVAKVGGGGFGGTPNINLTVMLEGRELRAFVKNVIIENLNPLK